MSAAVSSRDVLEAAERFEAAREQAALRTVDRPLVVLTARVRGQAWGAFLGLLFLMPLVLPDLQVFRVGRVLLIATSAIGMHLLVHWAGQISLAQAAFVGVPAFITARLASEANMPFAVTLPVGIAVGVLLGAVVALPALRVRGIQVAVVTLLFGVAVDRFLYTKSWFAGSDVIPVPSIQLGPFALTSSSALYPLLVAVFCGVVFVVQRLESSKVRRAMGLGKADEELAEARGAWAGGYKVLAFALAGGLAGVTAVLQAYWVTQVGASSFTFAYSLLILTIVIVAGRGSIAGSILAAFLLGFYAVPEWLPPLVLLGVVIGYPGGLNEACRRANSGAHSLLSELRGRREASDG